jgi:hypothetical protein
MEGGKGSDGEAVAAPEGDCCGGEGQRGSESTSVRGCGRDSGKIVAR